MLGFPCNVLTVFASAWGLWYDRADKNKQRENMKWKKFTIETTTQAEDFISAMLNDLGIDGIEIEDNIPLSEEEQKGMFIDFPPELPEDKGISKISFYLDETADTDEMLKQVKAGIEEQRNIVEKETGTITQNETEDANWINK